MGAAFSPIIAHLYVSLYLQVPPNTEDQTPST